MNTQILFVTASVIIKNIRHYIPQKAASTLIPKFVNNSIMPIIKIWFSNTFQAKAKLIPMEWKYYENSKIIYYRLL